MQYTLKIEDREYPVYDVRLSENYEHEVAIYPPATFSIFMMDSDVDEWLEEKIKSREETPIEIDCQYFTFKMKYPYNIFTMHSDKLNLTYFVFDFNKIVN